MNAQALKDEVKDIHASLVRLRENARGYPRHLKQLDDAEARLRRIEKHLGIEADLAA
jgi:hypothetical protein